MRNDTVVNHSGAIRGNGEGIGRLDYFKPSGNGGMVTMVVLSCPVLSPAVAVELMDAEHTFRRTLLHHGPRSELPIHTIWLDVS